MVVRASWTLNISDHWWLLGCRTSSKASGKLHNTLKETVVWAPEQNQNQHNKHDCSQTKTVYQVIKGTTEKGIPFQIGTSSIRLQWWISLPLIEMLLLNPLVFSCMKKQNPHNLSLTHESTETHFSKWSVFLGKIKEKSRTTDHHRRISFNYLYNPPQQNCKCSSSLLSTISKTYF